MINCAKMGDIDKVREMLAINKYLVYDYDYVKTLQNNILSSLILYKCIGLFNCSSLGSQTRLL